MHKFLKFIGLGFAALRLASFASAGSTYFDTSLRVSVATTTASPTRLIAGDPQATRTVIINSDSDSTHVILLGDASTTFSSSTSTGSARLPAYSTFSPDGPVLPYTGSVYAVSLASVAITVDVIRIK